MGFSTRRVQGSGVRKSDSDTDTRHLKPETIFIDLSHGCEFPVLVILMFLIAGRRIPDDV